ncbi:MAG TPA: 30S ribosome-binding factor RbfA [Methylomirabilota bacterium]|nr:30S ribosome-binding factor RbfA [Methylomirabilota bacterium]
MSLRLQRVNELLKRELGEVIRRELPIAEAGVVTVNQVSVAPDLHTATVFIGHIGTAEQRKRGIELLGSEKKRIQAMVGSAIRIKYTPQLRFIFDESVEKGNRVLEILDELDRTTPPDEGTPKNH